MSYHVEKESSLQNILSFSRRKEYFSKCLKTWRSAKQQFSCYNAYIIV